MYNWNIFKSALILFGLLILLAGCNKEAIKLGTPISILTNCSEGDVFERGTQVLITFMLLKLIFTDFLPHP